MGEQKALTVLVKRLLLFLCKNTLILPLLQLLTPLKFPRGSEEENSSEKQLSSERDDN